VVQGRYDVLSPFQNWRTLMQYTAAALAQHVRPMGRMVLGLSETLHGNGMVFRREVLERVPWQAYGLVEDMEYALRLTRQGYRIEYASDAIIYTQAPTTGEQALSQRLRWEGGRGSQARQNLLPLFRQAFQKRSLILLDRALDLLVPPLALLVMSVTSVALLNLFLWVWLGGNWSAWNAILGLALMAGLVLYVIGGLLVARVPWRAFVMLSFAPFYLLFKLRVYATLLFRHVPVEWVRTPRTSIKD
jgi:cellulose synthase/poly-beta-1,6-N-acetylglucosamine synthase-like glycosyltransferase